MAFIPKKIYSSNTPGQAPSSGTELAQHFNDNFDAVKLDLDEKDKKIVQLEQNEKRIGTKRAVTISFTDGYISKSGVFTPSDKRVCTDFVGIRGSIECRGVADASSAVIAFYDINKNFISSVSGIENDNIIIYPKIPLTALYYRYSASKAQTPHLYETDGTVYNAEISKQVCDNDNCVQFDSTGMIGINGLFTNNDNRVVSDYVNISNCDFIKFNGVKDSQVLPIAYYDVNFKYIGTKDDAFDGVDTVIYNSEFPVGAIYARFCKSKISGYAIVRDRIDIVANKIKPAKIASDSTIITPYYREFVNDTSDKIAYIGTWSSAADNPKDYKGSNHSTTTPGSYLQFSFVGSGFELFDRTGNRGFVEVVIDGVILHSIDRYMPNGQYQHKVIGVYDLKHDVHTVTVMLQAKRNTSATQSLFVFDKISIINNQATKLKGLDFNHILPAIPPSKNATQPLYIETYDGGNQGLHPKCLYFRNGWNGYKYWFVFTPYKDQNEAIENPCVYVSDDGINFKEPMGVLNPIDDIEDSSIEYNSDPHLVYNSDTGVLECWWRWVGRNTHPTKPNTEIIYRIKSHNGSDWGSREVCLEIKNTTINTRAAISPSIIYEEGKYKMWTSHCTDPTGKLRPIGYYEGVAGTDMTLVRDVVLSGGVVPSHIDVIKFNGMYRLIAFDVEKTGYPYYEYTFSNTSDTDYGQPTLIMSSGPVGSWDDKNLYRPSYCVVDGYLRLYYSAYSSNQENHCGVVILQ